MAALGSGAFLNFVLAGPHLTVSSAEEAESS